MNFFENINSYISCLFESNKDRQFIVDPLVGKVISYGEFSQEMSIWAEILRKEISAEHPRIAIIVEHNSTIFLLYFAIFYFILMNIVNIKLTRLIPLFHFLPPSGCRKITPKKLCFFH